MRHSRSFHEDYNRVQVQMKRYWFVPSCWHWDRLVQWHYFLPRSTIVFPNFRRALIPEYHESKADKLVVVFDLDETLVHSDIIPWSIDQPHEWASIHGYDGNITANNHNYAFKIRDDIYHVLRWARDQFTLMLWTKGTKQYADAILAQLDPTGSFFPETRRIYHSRMFGTQSKDLSLLGIDLKRAILVDDNFENFRAQTVRLYSSIDSKPLYHHFLTNGVLLKPWEYSPFGGKSLTSDQNLKELRRLVNVLETLSKVKDVRTLMVEEYLATNLNYSRCYSIETMINVTIDIKD